MEENIPMEAILRMFKALLEEERSAKLLVRRSSGSFEGEEPEAEAEARQSGASVKERKANKRRKIICDRGS